MVDYKHFSYKNCNWCGRFMTGDETEDSPYYNAIELTPSGEQIINGGFESALQHWTHEDGQTEEVVTTQHHTSTHSLHLKPLAEGGQLSPSQVSQTINSSVFGHVSSISMFYKCVGGSVQPDDCFVVLLVYSDASFTACSLPYSASWTSTGNLALLMDTTKTLTGIQLVGSSYAEIEDYVDDVSIIDKILLESVYLCGYCKKFASTTETGGQAAMEENKADIVGNAINPELSEFYKYPWI